MTNSPSMDKQGVFFPSPGSGFGPVLQRPGPDEDPPRTNKYRKTPFFWEGRSRDLATEGASRWPETDAGGEISTDGPGGSSNGGSRAELRPISSENQAQKQDFGLEKCGREAILVDGCRRSANPPVGPVDRKTAVFVSKNPRNPGIILEFKIIT